MGERFVEGLGDFVRGGVLPKGPGGRGGSRALKGLKDRRSTEPSHKEEEAQEGNSHQLSDVGGVRGND